MNATSAQLLKLLSSGIRPADMGVRPGAGSQGAGTTPFADLLRQARDGGLVSSIPVTIAGDAESAGVRLGEDQLARLSLAADKLETAGVRTALVSIDGQKLVLDVHARRITGPAQSEDGIVAGIDGAIELGDLRPRDTLALSEAQNTLIGAGIAPGPSRMLGLPSGLPIGNPGMAKLLAELAAGASG